MIETMPEIQASDRSVESFIKALINLSDILRHSFHKSR